MRLRPKQDLRIALEAMLSADDIILLAHLPDVCFSRAPDAESGCNELVIRTIPRPGDS